MEADAAKAISTCIGELVCVEECLKEQGPWVTLH